MNEYKYSVVFFFINWDNSCCIKWSEKYIRISKNEEMTTYSLYFAFDKTLFHMEKTCLKKNVDFSNTIDQTGAMWRGQSYIILNKFLTVSVHFYTQYEKFYILFSTDNNIAR